MPATGAGEGLEVYIRKRLIFTRNKHDELPEFKVYIKLH